MILDNLLMFTNTANGGSDPGDLLTATGTVPSTNNIDLHILRGVPVLAAGQGARDWGIGDDPALKLLVQVSTTFTSGGGGTLAVALAGAPDNGSGLPAAFTVWYTSPVYALATLTTGARLLDMDVPRPPDGVPVPRFLQLQFVVGGAAMTGGAVKAGIVIDRYDQMYNASNNAITGGYPPGVVVPN